MLSQHTLVGFIPTTDANRARSFYVDTLKLDFVSDDQFAVVVRSGENNIRIARIDKSTFTPAPFTILGWEVPDVEQAYKEMAASGVVFEKYPFVKDPSGIWSAPGGAKVAWFKDPDGNVLSISQHPK